MIGGHAWRRAAAGHAAWSLCGITHTTASHAVMEAIIDWLMAPVQPWDAVICTSAAVRQIVIEVLAAQSDYLRLRPGAQRVVVPQLPVIPLSVAVDELSIVRPRIGRPYRGFNPRRTNWSGDTPLT